MFAAISHNKLRNSLDDSKPSSELDFKLNVNPLI